MNQFIIAGTGSRELILDTEEFARVEQWLMTTLERAKAKHGDRLTVISGMAEGFDECLALCARETRTDLIAAVPNKGYPDYYWRKNSLLAYDRMADFNALADWAEQTGGVYYVCDGIYGPDGRHANFIRNEWMVDRASIVWVYNPTTRGTAQCYGYCKQKGVRTFIVPVGASK